MTGQTSSPHHQGAEPAAAPHRIVAAGSGPAAHRFADALHARGLEGWDVSVLTGEAHPPYDRVALRTAPTDTAVDLTLSAFLSDHKFLTLQTGERQDKALAGNQPVLIGSSIPVRARDENEA